MPTRHRTTDPDSPLNHRPRLDPDSTPTRPVQVDTLTHGRLLGYVPASAKGTYGYRAETSTDPAKWKARAGNFKRDACHGGHEVRKIYFTNHQPPPSTPLIVTITTTITSTTRCHHHHHRSSPPPPPPPPHSISVANIRLPMPLPHQVRRIYSTAFGGEKVCVEKKGASWTGNSHPHELNAVITVSHVTRGVARGRTRSHEIARGRTESHGVVRSRTGSRTRYSHMYM